VNVQTFFPTLVLYPSLLPLLPGSRSRTSFLAGSGVSSGVSLLHSPRYLLYSLSFSFAHEREGHGDLEKVLLFFWPRAELSLPRSGPTSLDLQCQPHLF